MKFDVAVLHHRLFLPVGALPMVGLLSLFEVSRVGRGDPTCALSPAAGRTAVELVSHVGNEAILPAIGVHEPVEAFTGAFQ